MPTCVIEKLTLHLRSCRIRRLRRSSRPSPQSSPFHIRMCSPPSDIYKYAKSIAQNFSPSISTSISRATKSIDQFCREVAITLLQLLETIANTMGIVCHQRGIREDLECGDFLLASIHELQQSTFRKTGLR